MPHTLRLADDPTGGTGRPRGRRPSASRRYGRRPGATGIGPGTGLTLIEIVVVLAILAVAMGLVLPSVGRGTETLRLRSEAGRVAALLREARQQAVTQRRTTRVTLDRTRNTVALTAGDPDHPVRELAMPPGLRLAVAAGGESLTFSSRGITRETRWIVEGSGGRRLEIDVEAVSGRVTVGREGAAAREGGA